jgi:hypothetical protein
LLWVGVVGRFRAALLGARASALDLVFSGVREAIGDFWIGQGLLQLLGEYGGFGLTLRKPSDAARQRDI